MTAYPAGSVRCPICDVEATFIELARDHQHPEPAPDLLAALQADVAATRHLSAPIPAIGHTSTGTGELAGGDVQALPRNHRPRTRKGNRHDQRTPLPGDPGFTRPSLTADVLRELLGE